MCVGGGEGCVFPCRVLSLEFNVLVDVPEQGTPQPIDLKSCVIA